MSDSQNIKILVVDDLPEKLLVYRSILDEPGMEVVGARSGREALQHLLEADFAVILLDVNMPGMDGFETAALIRGRKRCAHTPIIFITAYADELHALKGYSYGAVDYILAPVSAPVLRTKVSVFVQLFRLNRQLQQQTARRIARAENEGARLKAVLETATDLVARADLQGQVLEINSAGRGLLGYRPAEAIELTLADYHAPEAREQFAQGVATATRDGVWFGETNLCNRAGQTVPVSEVILSHKDDHGEVESISIIARDITQRKQAEETLRRSQVQLRAMFNQAAVGIVLLDREGRYLEVNERMGQLVGRPMDELEALTCQGMTHPDDWSSSGCMVQEVAAGVRTELAMENRYLRGDGSWVWVNVTVSPLLDEHGCVDRLIAVVEDISARKQAEAEVQRHRERLEELVRERTAELEESLQRLRVADRLASIGTLAAGLGHDMGNLLLPIRMRLESLEAIELPEMARHDVEAIRTASEYLRRLSQGLREFARDPDETDAATEATDVASWWPDVEPFLRNALPRGVVLEAEFASGVPPIALATHRFTQAVFNLVQNAGDALNGRPRGRVRISAQMIDDLHIAICITDNGPGMTEEVKNRCMEPFFTTKTRSISTGLGLVLVRNAILRVGGHIEIDSQMGVGTTVRLMLPAAVNLAEDRAAPGRHAAPVAQVHLADARMSAYVTSVLRSLHVEVRNGPWSGETEAELVVVDEPNGALGELEAFLHGNRGRRAVVFGAAPRTARLDQVALLEAKPMPAQIRETLHKVVRARETLEAAL